MPAASYFTAVLLTGLQECGTDMNGGILYTDARAWVDDQIDVGSIAPHRRALALRLLRAASNERVKHNRPGSDG